MYRVFGNPSALATHQAAVYLRHRGLPCKLHVANFMSTRLMGWWYGAESFFCSVSPEGRTLHTFLDLIEDVERVKGTSHLVPRPEDGAAFNVLHWTLVAYANWWLMLTCGGMRWIHGEGSSGMMRHCGYFLLVPTGPIAAGMARTSRDHMRTVLTPYGLIRDTVDYMGDHFTELLEKLDAHLSSCPYLLGHRATLADVMFVATFSSHFVQDEPPSSTVAKYIHVKQWVERVLNPSFIIRVVDKTDTLLTEKEIPPSVGPIVNLVSRVLPCLATQCDAFAATVSGFSKPEVEYGRIVPTPWTLRLPDTAVSAPCEVSLPHVHFSQYAAQQCAPYFSDVAKQQSEMTKWECSGKIIDTMKRMAGSTTGYRVACKSKGMDEVFLVTKT